MLFLSIWIGLLILGCEKQRDWVWLVAVAYGMYSIITDIVINNLGASCNVSKVN